MTMSRRLRVVDDLSCVWRGHSICGEGPLWIPDQQALYWVDIDGCKAHRYQMKDAAVKTWNFPEKTGWLLPRQGRSDFVAGCKSGIYFVDLESGQRERVLDPEPDLAENRFNDAKVDAQGRIWTGSMDDREQDATGWLYRIDPDLSVSRWDGPYRVTNGPAITPDGKTLYHVDTFGPCVYAFDKHPDGRLSNRRLFAELREGEGGADGLTVDDENCVWLAHWGGSRLTRFFPDGTIDGVLEMPVPQVTSCAFGGPDMNLLFITTAARNLDLAEYPLAGGLFCATTSVTGQASPRFKG